MPRKGNFTPKPAHLLITADDIVKVLRVHSRMTVHTLAKHMNAPMDYMRNRLVAAKDLGWVRVCVDKVRDPGSLQKCLAYELTPVGEAQADGMPLPVTPFTAGGVCDQARNARTLLERAWHGELQPPPSQGLSS